MAECAALSIVLKVSSWLSFRQSGPMWLFALELEKRPLIYSAVSPRQVEISVEIQTDNQETFQRSTQMTPAVVNLPAIRRHFDALLVIFGAPWKLIGPHSSMTWSTSIGQQMRHVLHCTTHTHRWWMAIFFLCHQTNRWIGRRWVRSARNGFFSVFIWLAFVIDSLGLCQDSLQVRWLRLRRALGSYRSTCSKFYDF